MSTAVFQRNGHRLLSDFNNNNVIEDGIDRIAKRPRCLSAWEVRLNHAIRNQCARRPLGLLNLFGDSSLVEGDAVSKDTSSIITLRLDHREGGLLSRHPGEERIIIFQVNRPAAIAKIIYSCQPEIKNDVTQKVSKPKFKAKIHVLDVKASFRGFDLGSLLVTEAVSSLRRRYFQRREVTQMRENQATNEQLCELSGDNSLRSIYCELDAEEDSRRHQKLVRFYERLGFSVKPNAKILYINNNDNETYRKVPMGMEIIPHHYNLEDKYHVAYFSPAEDIDCGVFPLGHECSFLPVILQTSSGKPVVGFSHTCDTLKWIIIEDSHKKIELRTTKGLSLLVDPEGECSLVENRRSDQLDWFKFRLISISDANQGIVGKTSNDDADDGSDVGDLWMLQSYSHGTFLALHVNGTMLYCTRKPSFWEVDRASNSLIFSKYTPPQRQHYRKHWMKQSVDYVNEMKTRYCSFRIREMSLRAALNFAACIPANPFEMNTNIHSASLRTRCFQGAEYCRNAGHPDWVQLLVLVYGLGGIVNHIDIQTGIESEHDYDWTIASRSRVVGCFVPESVEFGEFRLLNPDAEDSKYNSSEHGLYEPHCGLSSVLLSWTGPEYMYHMLRHNHVTVPEEGLKMLRLASLSDWHTKNFYNILADDDDFDVQSFIADFDELLLTAEALAIDGKEMTTEECNRLWISHYEDIASKYNLSGLLQW